ncbi:MAG: AAA family ATPase [Candidatus Aenigmarchaeota archaeon]|nr:AAA family ATPase [Candidatus Aenigmarchaeota archaeon]
MKISITGTPGCGKSTISKLLSKRTGLKHVNVNRIIKSKKLYSGYDKKRKAYIANLRKVKAYTRKLDDVILDSHLSHDLNPDIVFVLRCRPYELGQRMKKRRWRKAKVEENIEAEIIGSISWETRKHKKVFEIDTTSKTPLQIAKRLESIINGKSKKSDKVDWLK